MTAVKKNLFILFSLGFFLALAVALPAYIHSTYLSQFVGADQTGWFFIGAMVFATLAINFFPRYIRKFSNYKTALMLLAVYGLDAWLLSFASSAVMALTLFIILETSVVLLAIVMDVFVERFSADALTGRIRTVYYTFINFGWLISPFIAGQLVSGGGYAWVYWGAAAMVLPIIAILLICRGRYKDHLPYRHRSTIEALKKLWPQPNLRRIVSVAFLLDFFYGLAVIYIPIYLHQYLGFDWMTIGWMFTIMLLPFVLLEIPAGILADKYWGEKEILASGFIILSGVLIAMFLLGPASPLVWAIILFLSRCGAALTEAMRETYFFKKVSVRDMDYINLFRNAQPFGYIAAALLGMLILQFFPFNYLFLFFGVILLLGVYLAVRLEDTK
ncbi:MAG: MFS transporter [Patescibacteria group bacterium]|jgi:MFS family permease